MTEDVTRPSSSAPIDSRTRRRFVRALTVCLGGIAAAPQLACSRDPSRGQLVAAPDLLAEVYRGFVDAVVPGLGSRELAAPQTTRVFFDETLPFAPYHLDFAVDLCERCRDLTGHWRYDLRTRREREEVIESGLATWWPTDRLYAGAVFAAQFATYSGIYDPFGGCPLIEFEGASQMLDWSQFTYPDMVQWPDADEDGDGNPP